MPYARQEQVQLANSALSTLPEVAPELHFHNCPLQSPSIGWYQSIDILGTSILWMFQNHLLHCPNQMMGHIGILQAC